MEVGNRGGKLEVGKVEVGKVEEDVGMGDVIRQNVYITPYIS